MVEDPERHIGELTDCLMQSMRAVGFLLGAGCPCAVKDGSGNHLIPDINAMTETVSSRLAEGTQAAAWKVLTKTCDDDEANNQNIEQLLDRIRGLSSYAGTGMVRGLSRQELQELDAAICDQVVALAAAELPDSDNPYHALVAWIQATKRVESVEIFTTNYDLLIEQALERFQVPFFDGFVGARRPFFDVESVVNDQFPVRWTRLWKIHGSVNWRRDMQRREIYRGDKGDRVVIHPSHLKYDESRKLPYLALIDRLRGFLRRGQSVLVCCGFSFRDQHINEAIIDSLSANPTAAVFGLMYGAIEQYPEARALAKRAANLRLYADDACILGGRLASWREHKVQPESKFPPDVISWSQNSSDPPAWHPRIGIGNFATLGELLFHVSRGRRAQHEITSVRE